MERPPNRAKVERTPGQQAERFARDEAIRRKVKVANDGPEAVGPELRWAAGPPDWPSKRVVASLRAERLRRGLSLADVASRMGADRGALHKIEIGLNRNPTFDTLARYATALNVALEVNLVGGPAIRGE